MAIKERLGENLSNADKARLSRATEIAKMSACSNQHGAVITRAGAVVSVGINRLRNDPSSLTENTGLMQPVDISVHAEIAALRNAGDVRGGKIYVSRWMKSKNSTSMSRPCNNCYKAILDSGIKTIIYTD